MLYLLWIVFMATSIIASVFIAWIIEKWEMF